MPHDVCFSASWMRPSATQTTLHSATADCDHIYDDMFGVSDSGDHPDGDFRTHNLSRDVRTAIFTLCKIKGGMKRSRAPERDDPVFIAHCFGLFTLQDGCCALTGVKMRVTLPFTHPDHLSIDRINNEAGYTPGNVRLVCQWANQARWMFSDEMFGCFVQALQAYNVRIQSPPQPKSRVRRKTTTQTKAAFGRIWYLCHNARRGGFRRRTQMRTPGFAEHCFELFVLQDGRCELSGVEMCCTTDTDHSQNPFSLNIICFDKTRGYVIGNVALACMWITHACGNFGVGVSLEFVERCHVPEM